MSQSHAPDQDKLLTAEHYFNLANQYLDIYQMLSERIQDPATPQPDKEALFAQSEPILQQGYEFQKMGLKALTAQLNVSVRGLNNAVKDAAKTIKLIFLVGKVIEIATDIVAIGAVIAVPVLKPAALATLPPLIKELKKDVKDLKTSV
jgi:hypothetical protein